LEGKRACNDMAAGFFVASFSSGIFMGPFLAGILNDNFGGNEFENF
jgi:hypothetical protein